MKDKKNFKVEEDVSALQKAIEGLGKLKSSKLLCLYGTSSNASFPTCCTRLDVIKIKTHKTLYKNMWNKFK